VSEAVARGEQRVSPIELFFDLIFAFAFTQVTTLWLEHPTWGGLGQGLVILALLWWVWASYAWLTNTADAQASIVWAVMLFATACLFVAALATPTAFTRHGALFGVALFAVISAFVVLYALVSKPQRDLLAAVLRMARTELPAAALLLGASFAPAVWRAGLWALAVVVGLFGPNLNGLSGWRVYPAHFAERHGLILIIAIGESLAAIGFGAQGTPLDTPVIVAAVLGLVVAACFWLAYFDFASSGIESLLTQRQGTERAALARDAYTYWHLPMAGGILLFAFAMRSMLAHVGSGLRLIPALALCCGPAIYLVAFVGLRWRVSRTLGRGRPIAAAACALLTPVPMYASALLGLALVTAVWLCLHAYELIWFREERARRRAPPRSSTAE
jgi:low temperature requirement protein LtrA